MPSLEPYGIFTPAPFPDANRKQLAKICRALRWTANAAKGFEENDLNETLIRPYQRQGLHEALAVHSWPVRCVYTPDCLYPLSPAAVLQNILIEVVRSKSMATANHAWLSPWHKQLQEAFGAANAAMAKLEERMSTEGDTTDAVQAALKGLEDLKKSSRSLSLCTLRR